MMKQKMKKFLWLTVCYLFLSAFLLGNNNSILAASSDSIPENVTEASTGIVHIILSCTTPSGDIYYIRQGTGFVAGTNDNAQYILTTNSIVNVTDEELSQIRKWAGLSSEDTLTTQLSVLSDPDVLIPLTTTSVGSDVPYAILTPEQPLNNSSTFVFALSEDITRSQTTYLYGYDTESSVLGMTSLPDSTAEYRIGSITEVTTSPFSVSCDIDAQNGCAGAPLLDENGYVVGMFYPDGDNLEVLPADTLMELLDTLNISYNTSASINNYNVADDEIKMELSALLTECQTDVTEHADSYSKKTLSNYKTAITNAMEIMADDDSTKDDYQNAIDSLESARKKLKPHNFTFRVIQLILLAVLAVLALINVKQYFKTQNFLSILHPDRQKESSTQTAAHKSAALIRSNTNEVIRLSKNELRLGCDDKKVDYQITGNPAISRYHAAIIRKGNDYFLMDNTSTNHTSINHSILVPNQPYKLKDNDFILLADEPFVFRLI